MSTIAPDYRDLEVSPGVRVRDLSSQEECTAAIYQIEMDREKINAQIARAEAGEDEREPGWRTRAQTALRWKKRIRQAIQSHASGLKSAAENAGSRRQAILDFIKAEIGANEFEQLVEKAKAANPALFLEGRNDG